MTAIRVTACTLLLTLGVVTAPPTAIAQTPARDAAKPAPVGTATLSGRIVSDDADARPLRRVRVGITTSDRQVGRTVVTDDDGRFGFVALPAGRYMLNATKQGYVTTAYGAKRPNRPGTALVLADGQHMTNVNMRLTRGSVISGVLVDQNGEPFSGAQVSAMQNRFVGNRSAHAHPREQRADGRPRAIPHLGPGGWRLRDIGECGVRLPDARQRNRTTDRRRHQAGDVRDRVRDGAARRSREQRQSGGAAADRRLCVRLLSRHFGRRSGGPDQGWRRGGTNRCRFSALTGPDGEGGGQRRCPGGHQSADDHAPDGREQSSGPHVRVVQTLGADRRWDVHVRGCGPRSVRRHRAGHAARTSGGRPAAPGPGPRAPSHWARADVTIAGQDISGVSLTLQPGMVVAGRIQLEGTSAQPPDLSRIRINLQPVQSAGEVSLGLMQSQPDATRSVLHRRRHARPLSSDGLHPVGAARYHVAVEVVSDVRP